MGSSQLPEPEAPVGAQEYLASQPPARRVPDALAQIRERVIESGRRVIVLDDDPTGTQAVHDVPVLTTWSYSELRWALEQSSPTVYILTNSRSLEEDEAVFLNRQISLRLARAGADSGADFVLTSCSDSNLRGHYPAEPRALIETLETARRRKIDGIVVCPCFFEAGRVTIDDVQWVEQDGELVPAASTEFASDPAFGYSSSNLANWVEEKTDGEIPAGSVLRISLEDIRQGGPERIAEILQNARDAWPVVVNAAEYADLEIFILGLLAAEAAGKSFLYRTGPSFVRVRGGIPEKEPLGADELHRRGPGRGHGLVLVGSHVEQTTRQLREAQRLDGLHPIELSVPQLLDSGQRAEELDRVVSQINVILPAGDVVVHAGREVVGASENFSSLQIDEIVSVALVEVMRRVDRRLPLSFVVTKGGITTVRDVATKGLNVRRAEVAGQMMPGIISAWILPADSDYPGLPYIVFPGNVGGPDALSRVIEILREGSNTGEVRGANDGPAYGTHGTFARGSRLDAAETRFARVLQQAQERSRAVGAFTCYNLEELEAVIRAAETRRAPVIVLVSPTSFEASGGERLVRAFRGAADRASVEVLLQLDHVSDLRSIERAAACGIDAVMADGSRLPLEENIVLVRNAVSTVNVRDIGVEAELGRVEGDEDEVGETLGGEMTDPAEAESFARESGTACLAVAIGNVHGSYSGTPSLDWDRLREIQSRTSLPLSLHGASGLPDSDLRRAVSLGVCKVNVNTGLRAAYFDRLKRELDPASATLNLKRLGDAVTESVREVVEAKLSVFGWPGNAETNLRKGNP